MSETLLDQIENQLREALTYNENAQVAPVALLWPDRDASFAKAAEQLGKRMPILRLGDLDAESATGPAYWLRCAIAGTVDVELPYGSAPVLYLPGVGQEDLRAIEECPRHLAPLAELQYRGQWFAHPNGKDWTVRSLLSNSEKGLGLDIADDGATSQALLDALDQLLDLPSHRLAGHLDASFLHNLLNPDPVASLLSWLDNPNTFRAGLDEGQWRAFVNNTQSTYQFNPEADGEITGGRRLGQRKGAWAAVWNRFVENPARYAEIETRLRQGKPTDVLLFDADGSWPQDNEDAEAGLRKSLLGDVATAPPAKARELTHELWTKHRERREWVWAQLDRAPLVFALEHLARLADRTSTGANGDVASLADAYTQRGWQADDAFLAAIRATTDKADRDAVTAAALAVYRPWLDAHARTLQDAIGPMANSGTYKPGPEASTTDGTVTVFVDGLRLDVAHRLADALGGLAVETTTSLAALPTVTDCSKAALTPVPPGTLAPGKDLGPARATNAVKATTPVLRGFMADRGGQVLTPEETGDPSGWAWTEAGTIDSRGHNSPADFVDHMGRDIDDIAKRVRDLLDAGWAQVDVVTDHGWLFLPGGLEKAELPVATVELKKGRCARLKDGANVSAPTVPWHWDADVQIAVAPGITCFEAGKEYEHGGISLQKCVVPRMSVRAGAQPVRTAGASITRVKWLGLLCRVEFSHIAPGATIDIRALAGDPSTSVAAGVKETTSAGKQSLHVEDEDLEGETAVLVIVSKDGSILAQRQVTIGMNT